MDSSFISFLQIVANVKKTGSVEGIAKVTNLVVSCHEASKPIVCDTNGWNQTPLAAVFKACFAKDGELLDDVGWLGIWVGTREEVPIVQEYNFDSFHRALVNTERESTANADVQVVDVMDACRVLGQVASLSLPISLVVWGNDNHLLPQLDETDCQLIDHDAEATNCRPSSKFWSTEDKRSQLIRVMNRLCSSGRCDVLPTSHSEHVSSHSHQSCRHLCTLGQPRVVHEELSEGDSKLIEETLLN